MAKVQIIDGKHYRMRRGELVEIPAEWVGKITHSQTIRKRKDLGDNNKTKKGSGKRR